MFTVEQAARLYGVPLIDYRRDDAHGLLVASGSGIMMAVMDAVRSLRWCVDIDQCPSGARIEDFLAIAEQVVWPLGVCGWFSLTDPAPLRRAVERLHSAPPVYGGNVRMGLPNEVDSLERFVVVLNEWGAAAQSRIGPTVL